MKQFWQRLKYPLFKHNRGMRFWMLHRKIEYYPRALKNKFRINWSYSGTVYTHQGFEDKTRNIRLEGWAGYRRFDFSLSWWWPILPKAL